MTLRQKLETLERLQALRIERAKELTAQMDAIIAAKQHELDNVRSLVEYQELRIA